MIRQLAAGALIALAVVAVTATPAFAEGSITQHVGTFHDRTNCEHDGEYYWKQNRGADDYVCIEETPTRYELYVTWYT
ncbi:hypothetical protein ACQEVB_05680 [Pseudonocardia sp. CA-107938]|uniref:hypothetical protein n=1 Tax=Pseudonocardia sp. CA-107938 TaxID=3240021 RepID=UPI003D8BADB3